MPERLQVHFDYNAVQDRLLLHIIAIGPNGSGVEYRFWLTRRFSAVLLQGIDKLIEEELAADTRVTPEAAGAMKKFQREAALSKADFTTAYGADADKENMERKRPVLATSLQIQKKPGGLYLFVLRNRKNEGVHLTVGMDIVHSLQKMVVDAVGRAQWNKPLFRAEKQEPGAAPAPRYAS